MDSLSKEAEFLLVVQTVVQGFVAAALSQADRTPDERASEVLRLSSSLNVAIGLAARIPDEMPASAAASDFIGILLKNHLRQKPDPWQRLGMTDEEEWKDVRPSWMGLASSVELENELGPTEELIDGKWQLPTQGWEALPFDDSFTLKLLAHIRKSHGP